MGLISNYIHKFCIQSEEGIIKQWNWKIYKYFEFQRSATEVTKIRCLPKMFFFLIQENPVCSRKHKYGKFGRVEFGLNHDNYWWYKKTFTFAFGTIYIYICSLCWEKDPALIRYLVKYVNHSEISTHKFRLKIHTLFQS